MIDVEFRIAGVSKPYLARVQRVPIAGDYVAFPNYLTKVDAVVIRTMVPGSTAEMPSVVFARRDPDNTPDEIRAAGMQATAHPD